MADNVVHIGENSPEQVAYRLLRHIAIFENKRIDQPGDGPSAPDRKWLLDTYAECLNAVQCPAKRKSL